MMACGRPISAKGTLARARGRPSRAHQSRADGLELGGDGGHALGHDGRIGWCFIWGGATVRARHHARQGGLPHAVGVVECLLAAREACRLLVVLHLRAADRTGMRSLRRLLLSLSLCRLLLAVQPTLKVLAEQRADVAQQPTD